MMADDIVYFCNRIKFKDMENASDEAWCKYWRQRISDYYLKPAARLNRSKSGFASLTLICSAIEAIGTILYPNARGTTYRFEQTSSRLLNYTQSNAELFHKHYRCGLVHNGRTNQTPTSDYRRPNELSAIDYKAEAGIISSPGANDSILIVLNPDKLLTNLKNGFDTWFINERPASLSQIIKNEFQDDLGILKQLNRF